jgi:hypothetical protein
VLWATTLKFTKLPRSQRVEDCLLFNHLIHSQRYDFLKQKILKPQDFLRLLLKVREDDLLALGVASTGRFVMTCTAKNEMDILDLKGNVLSSITTNQMEVYFARISPDGKFVATSGIYWIIRSLGFAVHQ